MKSEAITNAILSPQWTAKLLHHFLSGAMSINEQGIKTELLYLVLPLIIDDVVRERVKTNIKSTFFTTFLKNDSLKGEDLLSFKTALLSKNKQVKEYKKFTNMALIYLGNNHDIRTGPYTCIDTKNIYQNEPLHIVKYCKASHYLGVIFAKEDHLNIFLKLGITNI